MAKLTPIKTTTEAPDKLAAAIYDMDCLSKQGFSQIRSLALLALNYMETPDGYQHPESIARALEAIWQIADNIKDCISNHAEDTGHAFTDEDAEKRLKAWALANGRGAV